jgi:hypothetical protein
MHALELGLSHEAECPRAKEKPDLAPPQPLNPSSSWACGTAPASPFRLEMYPPATYGQQNSQHGGFYQHPAAQGCALAKKRSRWCVAQ